MRAAWALFQAPLSCHGPSRYATVLGGNWSGMRTFRRAERNSMRRKIGLGLLPIMFLVAGFLYYTHNFPRCFDIWLWDETAYMYQGQQSGPIAFSRYEWAPLYSLFYRTISLFVPDPMHLYMAGSILILFAA